MKNWVFNSRKDRYIIIFNTISLKKNLKWKKYQKKIFNAIFLLLLLFIFISISGCSGTSSDASGSIQSSISKEQVTPADPASNNENNQEGVPLPPDEVNGIYIVSDHAFAADYMKGLVVYDISKRLNPVKISDLDLPG